MGLPSATILTDRLELRPLVPEDADEMASVLGDERLHDFIGGQPLPPEQLRARYERLAGGWSPDGAEQWCNWIVRVRPGGEAVGFAQATVTGDGSAATVAWVVGVPWQGRGYAAEAAAAVVGWLAGARPPRRRPAPRTVRARPDAAHPWRRRWAVRVGRSLVRGDQQRVDQLVQAGQLAIRRPAVGIEEGLYRDPVGGGDEPLGQRPGLLRRGR